MPWWETKRLMPRSGDAKRAERAARQAYSLKHQARRERAESQAQAAREATSVGPKGGQFYIGPSGEKVYVK